MKTILIIIFAIGLGIFLDDDKAYEKQEKEKRKDEEDQAKVDSDIRKLKRKGKIIGAIIMACAILIGLNGGISFRSGSNGNFRTCGYCHKTFTDSSNVKSIKKTNMCNSCYSSYKFGSEAKDAAEKYKEGN